MIGQTNKSVLKSRLQRHLRCAMTDAEQRLWRVLRGRQMAQYKFRRQHPFDDFILDFVCLEARLVVEVDGGQHSEQVIADAARTNKLERAGFRVLRFWNNDVMQRIEEVQEKIWMALQESYKSHPHPSPPLEGEGMRWRFSPLEGEGKKEVIIEITPPAPSYFKRGAREVTEISP